jgi:hypothetical protein
MHSWQQIIIVQPCGDKTPDHEYNKPGDKDSHFKKG